MQFCGGVALTVAATPCNLTQPQPKRLPLRTDSPDTGGWLGSHTIATPSHPSVTFGDPAYAAGPLCRCATSPHTVGSHPSRGAFIP